MYSYPALLTTKKHIPLAKTGRRFQVRSYAVNDMQISVRLGQKVVDGWPRSRV